MKTKDIFFAISGVAILAAIIVAGGKLRGTPKMQTPEKATDKPTDIRIYPGTVRNMDIMEVRARVPGFLDGIFFEDGDVVEAGAPLFSIAADQYHARVRKAEAQLSKDRAFRQKALRDLERIRPLYDQNAASRLDLDNATAAYESAVADEEMSAADLAQARVEEGLTVTRTPCAGRVRLKNAFMGRLVGPGSGVVLATLTRTDSMRVYVTVPARDFLEYQKIEKQPSTCVILADGSRINASHLNLGDPAVNNDSGDFTVSLTVPADGRRLFDGERVKVEIR